MNPLEIPDKFACYSDAIKGTLKKTIKIKLKDCPNSGPNLKPWQSNVAGTPYLPLNEQYPLKSDGEPFLFLAQINFSEVPHIDNFPEKGILQFYIDAQDDCMGLLNDGFKVLYFGDVMEDESKLHHESKKVALPSGPFEYDFTCGMEFSLESQYISASDYRFDNIANFGDAYELYDEYSELFHAGGHRLGGYPYFTQTDPRTDNENLKDHELLFQLDSDGDKILWGDMGVGAFFIKLNDLRNLDFSNVFYSWDCS